MSNVLRLALVDPNDASRDTMKAMLLGMEMVWLEAECSRYEFFADVVTQTESEVGLIDLDGDENKAFDLVSRLSRDAIDCALLVVSSSSDGAFILRAIRAGAKEFLTKPVQPQDLMGALQRISERQYGRSESNARGSQVIAVAGAIGGVGTTSIAVNLGCALAGESGRTVALVDLDLCLGDADVFLDAIPDYTLVDVAQNVGRLDFSLLKRSLTKHSSGLFLLPRPVQLEDIPLITAENIRRVIGLMKASFTDLVLDLSKSYSPIDMVALEMADQILLVTQLDLPCLRNIVRLMTSFSEMEAIADKIKIVVNRVGLDHGQITLKKAKDTIGRDIFWQFPNDFKTMVEVRNNGVPLVEQFPKAAITQSMLAMADALLGKTAAAPAKKAQASGFGKLLKVFSSSKGDK